MDPQQKEQGSEYLGDEDAQQVHRQAPELVVLDELVEIDT